MKTLLPLLLLAIAPCASTRAEDSAANDDALVRFAQHRADAVRITRAPVRMNDRTALMCATVSPDSKELRSPHRAKFVHVYVSAAGAPAMQTNSAVFPRGTIILKEKFADAQGTKTELFTGMIKREANYNPACGDWEFFTLSADASKVTSRGKLQSCIDCHVDYKNRDFVTKNYAGGPGFGAPNP